MSKWVELLSNGRTIEDIMNALRNTANLMASNKKLKYDIEGIIEVVLPLTFGVVDYKFISKEIVRAMTNSKLTEEQRNALESASYGVMTNYLSNKDKIPKLKKEFDNE